MQNSVSEIIKNSVISSLNDLNMLLSLGGFGRELRCLRLAQNHYLSCLCCFENERSMRWESIQWCELKTTPRLALPALAAASGSVNTSHSSCALLCPSTVGNKYSASVPLWTCDSLKRFESPARRTAQCRVFCHTFCCEAARSIVFRRHFCSVCTLVQVFASFLFLFFLRQHLVGTIGPR